MCGSGAALTELAFQARTAAAGNARSPNYFLIKVQLSTKRRSVARVRESPSADLSHGHLRTHAVGTNRSAMTGNVERTSRGHSES